MKIGGRGKSETQAIPIDLQDFVIKDGGGDGGCVDLRQGECRLILVEKRSVSSKQYISRTVKWRFDVVNRRMKR